jgi:predicted TIM-barrel fold metal-dependent hydrolase
LSPVFDTHAHIISPDTVRYPRIASIGEQASVPPANCFHLDLLLQGMKQAGVTYSCAVQRAFVYGADNSYVLDAARDNPDKLVPVIVLKADSPSSPEELKAVAKRQHLGGLRLAANSQESADAAWFNSAAALQTWCAAADLDIPVAIFLPPRQLPLLLPEVQKIAEMFPTVKIIIDHLGINHRGNALVRKERALNLPEPFLGPPDYAISDELKRLQARRNIHFKLTSINFERLEEDKVSSGQFVKHLVEEFGADRILWGSDIGQSEGPYTDLVQKATQATELLSSRDRDQILYQTAASLYRVVVP